MKEIIAHIGSGKCGSTAIQDALERHLDVLTEQRIALLVPSHLADINAMNMATYLSHQRVSEAHVARTRGVRAIPDAQEQLALFRDRIAGLDADKLVISNEFFVDVHPQRHAERLRILRELLPDDGSKLTLVYYVRKPDNLFASLYLQWFLPDLPVSMERFYRDFDFGGAGAQGLTLDWYRLVTAAKAQFPQARIIVRAYEKAAQDDLARDFWEAVGIDAMPDSLQSPRSNVSLRAMGYQVQARIGRHLPTRPRRFLYRALLRVNPKTRFDKFVLLSERKRRQILDYYAASYVRLFDEFGVGTSEELQRFWDINGAS